MTDNCDDSSSVIDALNTFVDSDIRANAAVVEPDDVAGVAAGAVTEAAEAAEAVAVGAVGEAADVEAGAGAGVGADVEADAETEVEAQVEAEAETEAESTQDDEADAAAIEEAAAAERAALFSKLNEIAGADVLARLESLETDAELCAKQTDHEALLTRMKRLEESLKTDAELCAKQADHEALLTRMKRLETALVRLFIYRRNNDEMSLHDRLGALEMKLRAIDEAQKNTAMKLEICRSRVQFSKTGCLSQEDVEAAMTKITSMQEDADTGSAPVAAPTSGSATSGSSTPGPASADGAPPITEAVAAPISGPAVAMAVASDR